MKIIKNLVFESDFGNIVYDKYLPNKPNARVIQIAHGMIEHKGRYEYLCKSFAQKGYTVFINDHRGHGDSIGGNIRLGEMGKAGFEKAVKDMFSLRLIVAQEFSSYKFVLFGHSMGSLLARRFLQVYEDSLDALILCGTPSPRSFLKLGSLFFRLLDKIGMRSSPKIGNIFAFNTKFQLHQKRNGIFDKSYWSCSDERVVKDFLEDSKCQFRFTLNSFSNLAAGMDKVFSTYPKKPLKCDLPIIFLSGAEDICGDFSKGVLRAYKHICSQGYDNVDIRLYEGARHEIFSEPCKDKVLADVFEWLKINDL